MIFVLSSEGFSIASNFIFLKPLLGLFINDNVILNNSNNASFEPKINIIPDDNSSEEVSGLYSILVSQVDYDLYKINGTDYHLSTKRCFKMGESINAQLKIYNQGKIRKKNICFLNEKGLEYSDCYQVKNVYKQIPTSNNKHRNTRNGKQLQHTDYSAQVFWTLDTNIE